MKYILYHSSITNDKSALDKLRQHAQNGEVVAEYFDDLSSTKEKPELENAIQKCRETGAMLLIMDLTAVDNFESSEIEGVQVKRLI